MKTVFEFIIAPVLVALFIYIGTLVNKARKFKKAIIEIRFKDQVPKYIKTFVIGRIKDGKDEVVDLEPINKKKEVIFDKNKKISKVSFMYRKNLGFQFKCFIDVDEEDYLDRAKMFIVDNGFINLSIDETKKRRIWFLIPEIPSTETKDKEKYINNFFHPGYKKIIYDCEKRSIETVP